MKLTDLRPTRGAKRKAKRVGRGHGNGMGKTCGRGSNGQNSRTGGGVKPGFEGGQMPLTRRLPKRGFTNCPFKVVFDVINICDIEAKFVNKKDVSFVDLYLTGMAKKGKKIKLLSKGECSKGWNISVHAVSKAAQEKIEKKSGKVILIK